MKKVYYILTIILSVLIIILFAVVSATSTDDIPAACMGLIITLMAVGFLLLSVLGLKKDIYIPGIMLKKAGVFAIGIGLMFLEAGLFHKEYLLQGISLFALIAGVAGVTFFILGNNLIRKKNEKAKSENVWITYKEVMFAKMPSLSRTLRSGVTVDDIRAAETEMGITFPEALKKLYMTNNGDDGKALCGMICGFHFLSLEALLSEWRSLKNIAENPEINNRGQFSSDPVGYIRKCYADVKWIPVCTDGSGNFIGIDLDPDLNGTAGQVINFGRDEFNKTVLAGDLNAFFERLSRFINSNDFYIDDYDGEEVIMFRKNGGEECAHLTDYLKDAFSVQ